jgi:phosphohistidine phosphatase
MTVLIIRHAIAVPRGTPGVADDERPLTPKGRKRFRQAARGLARIARRPDVILTSPLPRALQTAKIAAKAWGRIKPTIEPALADSNINKILAAIEARPRDAAVALVGHEPALSALLARLLGSPASERLTFRKGGAALVDLPGAPAAGGQLVWYLRPRILRALGRS